MSVKRYTQATGRGNTSGGDWRRGMAVGKGGGSGKGEKSKESRRGREGRGEEEGKEQRKDLGKGKEDGTERKLEGNG